MGAVTESLSMLRDIPWLLRVSWAVWAGWGLSMAVVFWSLRSGAPIPAARTRVEAPNPVRSATEDVTERRGTAAQRAKGERPAVLKDSGPAKADVASAFSEFIAAEWEMDDESASREAFSTAARESSTTGRASSSASEEGVVGDEQTPGGARTRRTSAGPGRRSQTGHAPDEARIRASLAEFGLQGLEPTTEHPSSAPDRR